MIKKEWMWMLNPPKNDGKVGLKSYMCNIDSDFDEEDAYIDGVDERPTPKVEEYNDDDYDY